MTIPTYQSYGADFADIYDAIFPREAVTTDELVWLADRIGTGTQVLELGVGTGRIAIPLAQHLAEKKHAVGYHGIDISPEMLHQLSSADTAEHVTARQGDIVDIDYGGRYDTILCLCATISMITDPAKQAQVFTNAAKALKLGGTLVVETHNADVVRSLHGPHANITYAVPYAGGQRALVSFSTLDEAARTIDHCWIDNGTTRFASEASRVTTLAELDTYARAAGLDPVAHSAGLDGSAIGPNSGTVTAQYRRPH